MVTLIMKIRQGGELTGDDRGQQHRTEERARGRHCYDGALLIRIMFGTAAAAAALSVSASAFAVCVSSLHPSMSSPAYSIIYDNGGSDDDDSNHVGIKNN